MTEEKEVAVASVEETEGQHIDKPLGLNALNIIRDWTNSKIEKAKAEAISAGSADAVGKAKEYTDEHDYFMNGYSLDDIYNNGVDDLNLVTKPGIYRCATNEIAKKLKNAPTEIKTEPAVEFAMSVYVLFGSSSASNLENTTSDFAVIQVLYIYGGGRTYTRRVCRLNETIYTTDWVRTYTTADGVLMPVIGTDGLLKDTEGYILPRKKKIQGFAGRLIGPESGDTDCHSTDYRKYYTALKLGVFSHELFDYLDRPDSTGTLVDNSSPPDDWVPGKGFVMLTNFDRSGYIKTLNGVTFEFEHSHIINGYQSGYYAGMTCCSKVRFWEIPNNDTNNNKSAYSVKIPLEPVASGTSSTALIERYLEIFMAIFGEKYYLYARVQSNSSSATTPNDSEYIKNIYMVIE